MFALVLRYLQPLEEVDKQLIAHREYLDQNYKKGIFLMSGAQIPRTGGFILAQAASRNEMESIIQEDPFVTAQVAEYEVIEFMPTKTSEDLKAYRVASN